MYSQVESASEYFEGSEDVGADVCGGVGAEVVASVGDAVGTEFGAIVNGAFGPKVGANSVDNNVANVGETVGARHGASVGDQPRPWAVNRYALSRLRTVVPRRHHCTQKARIPITAICQGSVAQLEGKRERNCIGVAPAVVRDAPWATPSVPKSEALLAQELETPSAPKLGRLSEQMVETQSVPTR